MKEVYQIPQIKELRNQQVLYTPREKKLEQLARAERLFHEIDVKKEYSYKYICFSITNYKPELSTDELYPGTAVREDLLLFIDDLSNSITIPVEEVQEPVWTIEQLSERFNVSHKTISRWRKTVLVSRHFLIEGKKRVGFLDSSVRKFMQNQPDRIRRGEQFSQLTPQEREAIIEQARLLSEQGRTSTDVAKKLSEKTGRSVETIRYTLKAFDESQHPQDTIFPNRNSPLRDDVKWKIYQGFRRGETIETLAKTYGRTEGSIYRIVGQYRARRILDLPLDYVDSPEFAMAEFGKLDEVFTGPAPSRERKARKVRKFAPAHLCAAREQAFSEEEETLLGPEVFRDADLENEKHGLPPYLARLYDIPLLVAEQEVHLFRKMNYLKYKASKLRDVLEENRPKAHLMSKIEECYEMAVETKNIIVSSNLRLVVSIAKKHIGPLVGFFELVSDGNLSLMKAVEKFDYTRGNKFSTYATWAIMRNFARSIPDEKRYRDRFHPSELVLFDSTEDFRPFFGAEEREHNEHKHLVDHLLEELSEREQEIIISRYGLGERENYPRTLRQIGAEMDVTKERVRQIELRALAKLRKVAEEEHLDYP